jgi:hypothetical protein
MSHLRLVHEGRLSKGYYNDMEAGYPVFIDGDSLSDVVKELLLDRGMSSNFCDDDDRGRGKLSENKLIGKRCRLTLEVFDD